MAITVINENAKELTFDSTGWVNVNIIDDVYKYTFKSVGKEPIELVVLDVLDPEVNPLPTDATVEELTEEYGVVGTEVLGGVIYEVSSHNKYVFARVKDDVNFLEARLLVRTYGTMDPSEDLTFIASSLSALKTETESHIADTENPHEVTKAQVGLGNIPNEISDDPYTPEEDKLISSVGVGILSADFTTHTANIENPHMVTKAQVGLDKVENFPIANSVEAVDTTNNTTYMTPAMTAKAVTALTEIAYSTRPQMVISAKIANRLIGWSNEDCSPPTSILEKINDSSFRVTAGLQVTFADGGKCRMSVPLGNNTTVAVSGISGTKTLYVYGDINSDTTFRSFSFTENQPREDFVRDGFGGDYYNIGQCVMYDNDDNPIRRVYIGRINLVDSLISTVSSVPLGFRYYQPITTDIVLGNRIYMDNPFISLCECQAEVYYNDLWGPTMWNDQSGIIAQPHLGNPIDLCVVQSGHIAYLAPGRESGSGFGANFTAITTMPKSRVLFTKKY